MHKTVTPLARKGQYAEDPNNSLRDVVDRPLQTYNSRAYQLYLIIFVLWQSKVLCVSFQPLRLKRNVEVVILYIAGGIHSEECWAKNDNKRNQI